jgi:hypothetical protein
MSQEELARARPRQVGQEEDDRIVLASAEDMVLQKLRWYLLGGGVSDRQWSDIVEPRRARFSSFIGRRRSRLRRR